MLQAFPIIICTFFIKVRIFDTENRRLGSGVLVLRECIAVVSLGYRLGTRQKAVPLIRSGNGHIGWLLLEFPTSLFLVITALVLPFRCTYLFTSEVVPCQGRSVPLDGELLL